MITGYQNPAYADSLSEFGLPRELSKCGGWILERKIADTRYADAAGCYPIFCCQTWSRLHEDLDQLSDLVALYLVSDPFGDYDEQYLRECFGDVAIGFKQHYVVDLNCAPDTFVSAHHKRNARKALRELDVEVCSNPADCFEDWKALYGTLKERHHIRGLAAFSDNSFAKQLAVPGIVVFRARRNGNAVGMLLWFVQGDRAYYHLGAYSEQGYKLGASFALFDDSIRYFTQIGLRWLSLGAAAGIDSDGTTGLNRFKEGWSNCSRTAYFCGRIFDRTKYQEILASRNTSSTNYFPAYRLGEFQ